jgi:hypothetical protein
MPHVVTDRPRNLGVRIRRTAFVLGAALATAAPAQARLAAPRLQAPAAGVSVQSLPAFTWGSVRGAAQYEFEFSADRRFSSGVAGFGEGSLRLNTTAITNDKTVADGTYYWRVRGVTSSDHPGPWSRMRVIRKAWTTAPSLISPLGGTLTWPSMPPLLQWKPVPYAIGYYVYIATDPALSNLVLGSANSPEQVQGARYVYNGTLAPGTYYWAVAPIDAENQRGPRSAVSTFNWVWPTTTTPAESNVATASSIVDPQFSWDPIPGAAQYQVEVNSSQDFPAGSKRCCADTIVGTSLSPKQLLPNETTLYWRIRALDVHGDAGDWNHGPTFTESFDAQTPTVPNLTLRDVNGNAVAPGSATNSPIVTWDPVPGASSYEIQVSNYLTQPFAYCDWSHIIDVNTASASWTPHGNAGHIGPSAWPNPENGQSPLPGGTYCFRVLARRDDGAQGGQVISDWTQLNGAGSPGFTFSAQPTPAPPSGSLTTPATAYLQPSANATVPRTPLFTWNRISWAAGYYVVVARDALFTDVIDVGFTNVPAYSPRIANQSPYADETTSYYWAIIPTAGADGSTIPDSIPQDNHPQIFNKSSVPPAALSPTEGSNVPTQPTFHWTSAEGARNYHLEIAGDPTFGSPIEDVTTDSTAYTSERTLPADKTLYWRVRANDAVGQGLNWSSVSTFTHHLPSPSAAAGNEASGDAPPILSWTPVTGAVSYDIHIIPAPNGSAADGSSASTSATFKYIYGPGIFHWQVRAAFPGGATSAYFTPEQPYVHTLPAPARVHATKAGSRIIISWAPDSDAKQYRVEFSTTDGFGSPIVNDTTDNTAWVPQIDPASASKTLFWRLAAVDQGGNVGAYATGVFHAPAKPKAHKRRKPAGHRKKKH